MECLGSSNTADYTRESPFVFIFKKQAYKNLEKLKTCKELDC